MHHHLEIVMPSSDDVHAAIKEIMAPFDENPDDKNDEHWCQSGAFWDYWIIGGRWAGEKLMAAVGDMNPFVKELKRRKITVSGLQFGKPTLSPASQIDTVNDIWNEMFPDAPVKECPLFDNYKGKWGDVMPLSDVPRSLTCSRVIVAWPDYRGKVSAQYMVEDRYWNGVCYHETNWDGTFSSAMSDVEKKLKTYKDEYRELYTPRPDWLVVTVDYHS